MSLTYKESKDSTPIAYDTESDKIIFYNYDDDEGVSKAYGKFEILPCIEKNQVINSFVTGASGSGKSTTAKKMAMSYRRVYPKNDIFMISQKTQDEAFNEPALKLRRIKIDEDFLNKHVDITKDFHDCLIIWDDFTYFESKKIMEKITKLLIQALTLGRSNKIQNIITAHLMVVMKERQIYSNIYNECDIFVFYSRSLNSHSLKYVLSEYFGWDSKRIRYILNFKDPDSRATILCKSKQYIMTENIIEILK